MRKILAYSGEYRHHPFIHKMRHQVIDLISASSFFVLNTWYNLDLADHGNPTPGTVSDVDTFIKDFGNEWFLLSQPVTVWGKWEGRNQCWRLEPGKPDLQKGDVTLN